MILQTDKRLPKTINDFGCFFMCIIYITCRRGGMHPNEVTAAHVLEIYKNCVEAKCMRDDCYILDALEVSRVIQEHLKIDIPEQWMYAGKHDAQYVSESYHTWVIGAWHWKFTHFVVMDGNGKCKSDVLYDPLGESWSVKNGELKSTRVFRDL